MIEANGYKLFGFWENMPYGKPTDCFDDFKQYKNTIDKESVIRHIESFGSDYWATSSQSTDIFTGESFSGGMYEDGQFRFPIDFLRYYKTQDIGIPHEYEDYLKSIGVGRVDL